MEAMVLATVATTAVAIQSTARQISTNDAHVILKQVVMTILTLPMRRRTTATVLHRVVEAASLPNRFSRS
jgi:hypothetical protein